MQVLDVEFSTGERYSLPAEYLRAESPAAEARDRAGRPKVGVGGVGRGGEGGLCAWNVAEGLPAAGGRQTGGQPPTRRMPPAVKLLPRCICTRLQVVGRRRHVGILGIHPVGSYAVR